MLRIALAVLAIVLGVLVPAASASAHTELQSTNPAEGAVVTAPVGEISLTFTAEVSLIDGGCEVLDPSGLVRRPDAVVPTDDRTLLLQFTTPLAGGAVGCAGPSPPPTGT